MMIHDIYNSISITGSCKNIFPNVVSVKFWIHRAHIPVDCNDDLSNLQLNLHIWFLGRKF